MKHGMVFNDRACHDTIINGLKHGTISWWAGIGQGFKARSTIRHDMNTVRARLIARHEHDKVLYKFALNLYFLLHIMMYSSILNPKIIIYCLYFYNMLYFINKNIIKQNLIKY